MKNKVPITDKDRVFFQRLGRRIRVLRKQAGYSSLEKFANDHDFDRAQYGRYETGHNMTLQTLHRILTALDVEASQFFNEDF